jgi:hypothetical protein
MHEALGSNPALKEQRNQKTKLMLTISALAISILMLKC